jgi:hypothetical protein
MILIGELAEGIGWIMGSFLTKSTTGYAIHCLYKTIRYQLVLVDDIQQRVPVVDSSGAGAPFSLLWLLRLLSKL